jgi:hypothetical protein
LPKWRDEDGRDRLAAEIVANIRSRFIFIDTGNVWLDIAEREEDEPYRDQPSEDDAHWPAAARKTLYEFIRAEKEAVRAGNKALLAELLLHEHFEWLHADTRKLIADIILRKDRRGPGRPRMTRAERRKANPIHEAAAVAKQLQKELQRFYPEQSRKVVGGYATEYAAAQANIECNTLINYRNRSRKAPQRMNYRNRFRSAPQRIK